MITPTEFISRSIKKHGNRYDYTQMKYLNTSTKIEIKCNVHNVTFFQTPEKYMIGQTSCKKCIVDKKEKTSFKNYGVKHPAQSLKVQEKMKKTCLMHHGVEYPAQSPAIYGKFKKTMLKNHGVEFAMQSEKIIEKTITNNIKKYGFEYPSQSKEIYDSVKRTNLSRYGVEYHKQKHFTQSTLDRLKNKKWLILQHHTNEKTLTKISQELKVHISTVYNYCLMHNIKIKHFQRSMGEMEVSAFINDMGYETINNTNDVIHPKELDIFIPQLHKAIEYNGIYYHKFVGCEYHKNKTDMCNKINVSLMHVWEDQWINNNEETKTKIVNFLNDEPQVQLLDQIEIDLATDNPQIYTRLGYKIKKQFTPQLYLDDIWDCGMMILNRK